MDFSKIKAELWTLLKSFLGAVAAAAAVAALNWLGAHIPTLLQAGSTMAAAYATLKVTS